MQYPHDMAGMPIAGMGYLGEVRQGADGNEYQLVQGIDGLGNPVISWKRRRHPRLQRTMRPNLVPVARRMSRSRAARVLQQAGMAGYIGLGELYAAPDGSVYQVEGIADYGYGEYLGELGQDDLINMMGIGTLGEVRQGPDGNVYQWVQGIDGLGGRWRKRFRRLRRKVRRVVARALPIAQKLAPFIPGVGPAVAAGITAAKPLLKAAKLAEYDGIGALYEAEDGTLYQNQGVAEGFGDGNGFDGFADEDPIEGFADDEFVEGFADEDPIEGFADDEFVEGFADEDPIEGFADDEEMAGFGQGYVRQDQMNGLAAYVPEQPPATRWFQASSQPPRIWETPW